MMNRNSMVDACIVKTWLYCCSERKLFPCQASWVRTPRARRPPMRKKNTVKSRYMIPIFLWSVVVIQERMPAYSRGRRIGRAIAPVAMSAHPKLALGQYVKKNPQEDPCQVDEV